jgi:hypothetical protein
VIKLVIASALVGATLAQRFKVMTLVLAIGIVGVLVVIFGVVEHERIQDILSTEAETTLALNIGYFLSAIARSDAFPVRDAQQWSSEAPPSTEAIRSRHFSD